MEDQTEGKMVVKRREEGRRAGEVGTGKGRPEVGKVMRKGE